MVTDQGLARIQRWMQACIEDQGTCEEAIASERAQSAISAEEARSIVLPSKTLSSLERLDIYRGMYLLTWPRSGGPAGCQPGHRRPARPAGPC
ncbi:MAG TPA: hypothetical protein VIX89_06615 [Bryobacteraceae bacterium]